MQRPALAQRLPPASRPAPPPFQPTWPSCVLAYLLRALAAKLGAAPARPSTATAFQDGDEADRTAAWAGPVHGPGARRVGVTTEEELRALGAVEAYARLKFFVGKGVTLNALYAMDAALAGLDGRLLPEQRKAELKAEVAKRLGPAGDNPAPVL
ncbi:TfoX/Sxy family DNA transformation protein [Phenylobacterium sp.]|uniref:TfoX/Sxy family DNA transformation protein n=1 Tax=Phenylobacterium sp. TaxID=1871053 RepID=UPI002E35E416|nr:TfoX/Sxy family DNA transformation protein [Phenylobacterium sp.]HEX2559104.1 TfoX/Sxy family DNA transformation protein [Phenylobacterium sp.]